jgi:hypothetical protein
MTNKNGHGAKRARKKAKRRRTKAEMQELEAAIYNLLLEEQPATDRQVFYRIETTGLIAKTEAEYNGTVIRLLSKMRLAGQLPWHWIADNSRWMRKPSTYSSLEEMLRRSAQAYRRSVWDNQNAYVEVWTEKDALAGVLWDITQEWDIPLMVSKGFASLSFLYSAAENIAAQDKPAFIYYFGDHDPSGLMIDRQIEKRLRQFAPDADITFERVAVTPEQIIEMDLPSRPTKRKGTHAKNFEGDSTEVDAIPPATLREIANDCILRHVDQRAYGVLLLAEEGERETLNSYFRQFQESNELPF